MTSFDTFQTHFGTKLCTCDSYLLAKVNITLVMFIKSLFLKEKINWVGHEYKVWYQNEFRKCQRMSMGTHLKLDIRTSYFPSTPISDMKFCGNRKESENTPSLFYYLEQICNVSLRWVKTVCGKLKTPLTKNHVRVCLNMHDQKLIIQSAAK